MTLEECRQLLEDFLDQKLTAETLTSNYITLYKQTQWIENHEHFLIMDYVFALLDMYWPEATPDTETPFFVSEETLRREAEKIFEKINQLLDGEPSTP